MFLLLSLFFVFFGVEMRCLINRHQPMNVANTLCIASIYMRQKYEKEKA